MKGKRTLIAAVLLAILPALDVMVDVMSLPEMEAVLNDWLPEKFRSIYALFSAILMFYMRTITTTPVGSSE